MMERNSYQAPHQKLAIAISLCLHALLLLGAYYLSIRNFPGPSSEYSIVLAPAWGSQETVSEEITHNPPAPIQPSEEKPTTQPLARDQQTEKPIPAKTATEKIDDNTVSELQESVSKDITTDQVEDSVQDLSEADTVTNQEEVAAKTIDERGLYKLPQGKQTGALLELSGWMWDTVPQPQDDTDESGKIIFQITIDELGEVIALKTLEKTISPLVEKIYKEALTTLTFSKTTNNTIYAPTSTGKVTFILQVK